MSNVFDRRASHGESPDGPEDLTSAPNGETTSAAVSDSNMADVTPGVVKRITQELLRQGYIEEAEKAELFQQTVIRQHQVAAALEPLDLALRLDTHRGVALVVVAECASDPSDEEWGWSHPLVRRHRLTLQQSLLVAWLRQAFVMHEQEQGVGSGRAKIAVEDLLPQFLTYFEDSGSDAKNESRLKTLLDQLKAYGIVSEIDASEEVTIRPLIAHLATPESLNALLQVMREQVKQDKSTIHDASDTEAEGEH